MPTADNKRAYVLVKLDLYGLEVRGPFESAAEAETEAVRLEQLHTDDKFQLLRVSPTEQHTLLYRKK